MKSIDLLTFDSKNVSLRITSLQGMLSVVHEKHETNIGFFRAFRVFRGQKLLISVWTGFRWLWNFYLFNNPNSAFIKTNGVGGQPLIVTSTGITLETAPQLA